MQIPLKLPHYSAAVSVLFFIWPLFATCSGNQDGKSKYPPYVLIGTGKLVCDISASKPGRQTMSIARGQGISFDVDVNPITDGLMKLRRGKKVGVKKPAMNYNFTSKLRNTRNFAVSGFGKVELASMETLVSIDAHKYTQPRGPGTDVIVAADDMVKEGVYIEFRGRFKQVRSGKKFSFRTLLGTPSSGKGRIKPRDSNDHSRIVEKRVIMDIRPLKKDRFSSARITSTIREL